MDERGRLGVAFIGAGFVTKFHIQAFVSVRDADVVAVMSPTLAHADSAAALARELDVGDPRSYT